MRRKNCSLANGRLGEGFHLAIKEPCGWQRRIKRWGVPLARPMDCAILLTTIRLIVFND
jgi:hypothetical protein